MRNVPFIIAEIGSNFRSQDDCVQSIKLARACGADAVKFQLFTERELYGFGDKNSHTFAIGAWIEDLAAVAKNVGIEFMCTAFSPEGVDIVDPFVKKHKVASSENAYTQLLDRVASKGKPVFISTGGSSISDMKRTLDYLKKYPSIDVTLLYCVSSYPAKAFNLFKMEQLAQLGKPVGFSDHSTDELYAPLSASVHFDARVIEKHMRLDKITNTPDAGHSITPDAFKKMVDHIRGTNDGFRSSEEDEAVHCYNRRLIATKRINVNEKLLYGVNFGCYRSKIRDTKGLGPLEWQDVQEKRCASYLKIGDSIGPKDYLK